MSIDPDDLFDALRALPPPRPDRTQHQRRRRHLDDAIAADAGRRAARLSPLGIVVAFVAASAAAAAVVTGVVVARADDVVPVVQQARVASSAPVVAAPAVEVVTPVEAPAVIAPEPPTRAAVDDDDDDDRHDVADAGVTAIVAAIDAADADDVERREHRQQCARALRHQRDGAAIEVCRDYSRHHPDDVAARPLAFGAGGLAEELGRFDDAIDLYTRCIVMPPLHGESSADALKARARVHAHLGHVDDATADLRLFLRLRPVAALDDDVRALAEQLHVR